ncbi:MAG: hydroxymethylbilane synthase [Deltaproteobacteria bacterium]|nr:hydroxymethylbilane synthase [Deltaproteobacteria bacterium]
MNEIIIGTRGSKLALWQANWVKDRITENFPEVTISLKIIKTTGDKILDVPLAKVGGKGLFVKEIEEALFREEIDLAVHSMKDVPSELPDGLILSAYTAREDPRDAFVGKTADLKLEDLPAGSVVGTSSLRRQAHLTRYYPHLKTVSIRGNLDTRIRKIEEQGLAGVLLAAAGLKRMALGRRISQFLHVDQFIPAVGQGVLGIETRENDPDIRGVVSSLNNSDARDAVLAERGFLKTLEGGCQVPIAAHATLEGAQLFLHGMVASLDGKQVIEDIITGERKNAAELGQTLAETLLSRGAGEILKEVYSQA